jgi:hypothetical protein
MDFIERLFNISPDGGSGATELLFLIAGLIAAAVTVWRIRPAGSTHSASSAVHSYQVKLAKVIRSYSRAVRT